jgi:translation initiation factor IF-1
MDIAPQPKSSAKNTASGIVVEALPNTLFRVELQETKETILAYLAGKMRMNRIRVLIGDKVELDLDPYGGRARITRRS